MASFPFPRTTCLSDFRLEGVTNIMITSLIPKIDLPKYFTITSTGLSPTQVGIKMTAEATGAPALNKALTFEKTNLVLWDFVDLFGVDPSKLPTMGRMALSSIAMPRDFELAASRVRDNASQIELSFELRGTDTKRWAKVLDTSNLNLQDLSVLLDWLNEAKQYQR